MRNGLFKPTSLGPSMFESGLLAIAALWVVVYGPDTVRLAVSLYKVAEGVYKWAGLL